MNYACCFVFQPSDTIEIVLDVGGRQYEYSMDEKQEICAQYYTARLVDNKKIIRNVLLAKYRSSTYFIDCVLFLY